MDQHAPARWVRQIAGGARVDSLTSVGFVGVGLIVAAYFANQQGWLNAEDWRFPAAIVRLAADPGVALDGVEFPVRRDRGDLGGDQSLWADQAVVLALANGAMLCTRPGLVADAERGTAGRPSNF